MDGLVEQAPSVAAIVFIVCVFMKYLTTRDKALEDALRDLSKSIENSIKDRAS